MDWLRRKPTTGDPFHGLGDKSQVPLAGGDTEGAIPPDQVAEYVASQPFEWDNSHWSLGLWPAGLLSPRIRDRSGG